MLPLSLIPESDRPLSILCLGAHCDDIEIGCGGSLLSLLNNRPNTSLLWCVFTSDPVRRQEAIDGARLFTRGADAQIDIHEFRDGYLPYEGDKVKSIFEEISGKFKPDVVFTHYRFDLHQDHRLISELTWNTFRNHVILEYEIPKWDGDLGIPNTFVELDNTQVDQKLAYLRQAYASQSSKKWFTDDLFMSLLRIRGMECHSSSGFAEGFHSRKILLNP